MHELITVGSGKCAFMELVRGILRVVSFLAMVLKLLKTVGFWKCGEDFQLCDLLLFQCSLINLLHVFY